MVLDFEGVVEIGQTFADVLFRVLATANPQVLFAPTNMSEQVGRMVRRARAAAGSGTGLNTPPGRIGLDSG